MPFFVGTEIIFVGEARETSLSAASRFRKVWSMKSGCTASKLFLPEKAPLLSKLNHPVTSLSALNRVPLGFSAFFGFWVKRWYGNLFGSGAMSRAVISSPAISKPAKMPQMLLPIFSGRSPKLTGCFASSSIAVWSSAKASMNIRINDSG